MSIVRISAAIHWTWMSCVLFAVTNAGEASLGGLELRACWNAMLNGHWVEVSLFQ